MFFEVKFVFLLALTVYCVSFLWYWSHLIAILLNFGMGDEGTSKHVLVEHGKAENELEELQLTKSDKSK